MILIYGSFTTVVLSVLAKMRSESNNAAGVSGSGRRARGCIRSARARKDVLVYKLDIFNFLEAERERGVAKRISRLGGVKQGESVERGRVPNCIASRSGDGDNQVREITTMVLIGNDDGKKMVEREEAWQFLYEYAHATGIDMELIAVGERPDFACEKEGQRYGLELVKVMQNPEIRRAKAMLGEDTHFYGADAAWMVQETVYAKEEKRSSTNWTYPDSTILVLQLVGGDGEELMEHLDEELMDEISETGFCEIWIADDSTVEPYGNVQLIGIKPKQWRGLHRHSSYGKKEYDY